MRIRENLGGLVAATSKSSPTQVAKPQMGKVFAVIHDDLSVPKDLFEKSGRWDGVGTVFYLDYPQSKNIEDADLYSCKVAKPFHPGLTDYPLVKEIIHLIDAPSPVSQVKVNNTQKYYTGVVNLWNNDQQNSPSGNSLGKTFIENADIRKLRHFEGDRILTGRKGNGIRFGSTVKARSNVNEWSNIGKDGDPITILVNGYVTSDPKKIEPNIEEINKEMSSVYLTSSQKLPLVPGVIIKNPVLSSIQPDHYYNSQIIMNSDRITLNSKKDEVLIFSQSNIELSTDQIININAGKIIHLHIDHNNSDSKILLGTYTDGTVPFEPVLLGGQTRDLLVELLNALSTLGGYLAQASAATSTGAAQVISAQAGGTQLLTDVNVLLGKLKTITSKKVYTV